MKSAVLCSTLAAFSSANMHPNLINYATEIRASGTNKICLTNIIGLHEESSANFK